MSLQVKLYQERPKNLSVKYLIPRFNDNDNNNNFSFQTFKTYFSNFLKNLKLLNRVLVISQTLNGEISNLSFVEVLYSAFANFSGMTNVKLGEKSRATFLTLGHLPRNSRLCILVSYQ